MLFRRKTSGISWIIAGLGNPGKKYEKTRHNIGFDSLDYCAEKWGISVKKSRFDALCGEGNVEGEGVLLLKPQTFVNLSGQSLLKASEYYKIPPEKIIIIFDDVSLAPGYLRIRDKGSAGGHNGLKSIITFIGDEFPRIKIGVGEKPHPDYDLAAWVLGRLPEKERKAVEGRFDDIKQAAELIVGGNLKEAMSKCNGLGSTL